jgi:hypothetical protein
MLGAKRTGEKQNMMQGWKTWIGAAMVASVSVLKYCGMDQEAEAVLYFGAAMGLVGIGHKVEKSKK